MADNDFVTRALFEHRFWLQIMGDHARFILTNLAPSQQDEIRRAKEFITVFDQLLSQARRPMASPAELASLSQQAAQQVDAFRTFKLNLQSRLLSDDLQINLPPTFFNDMINELDEYRRIIRFLSKEQVPPPQSPLHYHLLWLNDAAGHGITLADRLDPVERPLIERSEMYFRRFLELHTKAENLSLYTRTGLQDFPALIRFNREAAEAVVSFHAFLLDLLDLVLNKQALGAILPLIPDHMSREECYYLINLSMAAAEVQRPNCDPTRPRVQA